MQIKLKDSVSSKKTLLLLSLLCILSGAICSILGDLILPALVGLLAVLYTLFYNEKRGSCLFVSIIVVLINVFAIIFGITYALFSVQAIILAALIRFAFVKRWEKSDSSYIMTIISVIFTLITAVIFAVLKIEAGSFEEITNYYSGLIEKLKNLFADTSMFLYGDVFKSVGIDVSAGDFAEIFESQVDLLISYLVIGAFLVVGLSYKIFTAITLKISENREEILNWRFTTTNLFAYFYIVLVFATLFTTNNDSLFSITVLNLYNIFLVIFAYIGFNVFVAMLSSKMKPIFAILIVVGALSIVGSLALQILAVWGVLFTIRLNNEHKFSEQ